MKNRFKKLLSEYINNSIDSISKLDYSCSSSIIEAAELIISSLKKNNKLLICGNGGSAADSQHIAAELVGRYKIDRKPIAAVALTTDTSAITSIGNDYSFDDIFSRQVEGIGLSGDTILLISTSGNSKNIIKAANTSMKKNISIISLTGGNGGKLKDLSDLSIIVPSSITAHIQEMHIIVGHLLCSLIEDKLIYNN